MNSIFKMMQIKWFKTQTATIFKKLILKPLNGNSKTVTTHTSFLVLTRKVEHANCETTPPGLNSVSYSDVYFFKFVISQALGWNKCRTLAERTLYMITVKIVSPVLSTLCNLLASLLLICPCTPLTCKQIKTQLYTYTHTHTHTHAYIFSSLWFHVHRQK